MKRISIYSIVLLVMVLSISGCKKDEDDRLSFGDVATSEELTQALNDIYANSSAPGFAVTIAKHGEIIYQNAFGKADINNKVDYSTQTTQPIGSISKTFVAAAIVKAIEQGYFTLETDINELLPVTLTNPKQPNAIIRVKHLVTHTSGLVDNYEAYFQAYHILPGEDLTTSGADLLVNGFGFSQRETIPLQDFLAEYYLPTGDFYSSDNFAENSPGSVWNYSNIATSLAAYIIESATEMPFNEYVKENILLPLAMNQSNYGVDFSSSAPIAVLYWDKQTPLPRYGNDSYPDGSIHTNIEDMGKYLVEMMNGAAGQSTIIFSDNYYELLFSPKLSLGLVPAVLGENHGVFWFLAGNKIRHDGSDPGTTCEMEFDANGTAGYVLLTNLDASTDEHEAGWFEMSTYIKQVVQSFIESN